MKITILTEKELRRCVRLDLEVIDAIEAGFSELSSGRVSMPPIMRIEVPEHNGELDVKSALVPGQESFAVKMSSGFFDNHRLGLPSLSGMMVLFSAITGRVEAVLLDNGYLTDVRTGAAGAVAARHLANPSVRTAGVIGAGAQARYQMQALMQVRDIRKVLVYSLAGSAEYAAEMPAELGVEVELMPSAESVVRAAEVVVTTTPSKAAYLEGAWLHPGLHITAMGSDAEEKRELTASALERADRLVCDSRRQVFRLGEFHHGLEAGVIGSEAETIELGELTAGRTVGRRSPDEITICDLTGTGMQDTIIAGLAYRRAKAMGQGMEIES